MVRRGGSQLKEFEDMGRVHEMVIENFKPDSRSVPKSDVLFCHEVLCRA